MEGYDICEKCGSDSKASYYLNKKALCKSCYLKQIGIDKELRVTDKNKLKKVI